MIETSVAGLAGKRGCVLPPALTAIGIEFANVTAHATVDIFGHRETALHKNVLKVAKDFRE